MRNLLILLACAATTGCAGIVPDRISAEYEHVSHPLAGAPFESQAGSEDTLDHVGIVGSWEYKRLTTEAGIAYKVNRDGFAGPDMTGTVRVRVRLWEK